MKHIKIIFTAIALMAVAVNFSSCYKNVADAPYPASAIYMPTATNGFYTINSLAIPGQTYRYSIDAVGSKFAVPLGVYRSGITNDGDINVNIAVKPDTINTLISSGALSNTVALPATAYSIPSSATIASGDAIGKFTLSVDLNFLLNNSSKSYAIALAVSSTQITSTSKNLTVIIINPAFLIPTANFTYVLSSTPKQYNFTNTSSNSISYSWNFGDGSAAVTDQSPVHAFASSGSYTVTLTSQGAAGANNPSVKTAVVTVP